MRWMRTTRWGAAPAGHAAVGAPARAKRIACSSCSPIATIAARAVDTDAPSPKRRPCSPKAPRSEDAAAAVAEHHYQVKTLAWRVPVAPLTRAAPAVLEPSREPDLRGEQWQHCRSRKRRQPPLPSTHCFYRETA
jgi:hypothetical protein